MKISTLMLLMVPLVAHGHSGGHGHHEPKEEHKDEHHHEQHGAHVHGLAEMSFAQDGNQVNIFIKSPAANFVGFEHAAQTEAQKKMVAGAQEHLANASKMFKFNGTSCSLENYDFDFDALMKDAHHDDHHHDKHHDEVHSDISLDYTFNCKQGQSLTSVEVHLFEHFKGLESLQTEWIVKDQQGSQKLTASNNQLSF